MKINLFEEKFIAVNDIILIKTFLKRLSDYEIKNDSLLGSIFIDLSYYDKNMDEHFKTLKLDYAVILKDTISVSQIELNDVECELVDLKGVNVRYSLDISYENNEDTEFEEIKRANEVVEATIVELKAETKEAPKNDLTDNFIDDKTIIDNLEREEIQEITDGVIIDESIFLETEEEKTNTIAKKILKEEYDNMLKESLTRNNDVTVSRTENETEESFFKTFARFEEKYLIINKYLTDEKHAMEILDEAKIPLGDIDKYYDREAGVLTIKSYE